MNTPVITTHEEIHDIAAAPHLSKLPAFLHRIEQQPDDFVLYDDGWRAWTYTYPRIAQMARHIAATLRSHGVRKSDHVVIWSESSPGWIAALWACLIEGFVLVPIEPQSSIELFQRIFDHVQPRALLLGELPGPVSPPGIPTLYLHDLESAATHPPLDPVRITEDDLAEIIFTSGTTAEPKGVLMTHRNLAASIAPLDRGIAPYRRYVRFFSPVRVLNLLPMSHLFGQVIALFILPLLPATVVFLRTTHPEEIARQLRSRRICALVSVPKVLEVLREFIQHRFPETRHESAPSHWLLRWWRYRRVHRLLGWRFSCFVVGGAPLPPDVELFWRKLGFVIVQGYGLTETAPIISFNHPFHPQKGTTGKPLSGVELKLAPDGEVLVRGDNVSPGYYHQTSASIEDGWLRTGDLGELTPTGDLILRGRKKDLIVTPEGLKVHPEDVEALLNTLPGVRESAVVDNQGAHAVLILHPGIEPEAIIRSANTRLEPHQRIRSFSVWPSAELPRTPTTGKLRRGEVAATIRHEPHTTPQPSSNPLLDLVRKYAPGRHITPDTTLEELGLTSLDRVELMLDLEDKLDIDIDDSALASVHHISQLAQPLPQPAPSPQPTWNRRWPARLLRRVLLPTILLPLTRFYARLRITGSEHLRNIHGPVLFAANHQSAMDAPVILCALPAPLRNHVAPVMAMELFDPHFHPGRYTLLEHVGSTFLYILLTTLFNAFPLSQREAGTRQSLRYTGELIESGSSILIFPEGERSATNDLLPFQPGAAMIAARMRIPVIPIRLIGLNRVLPKAARWPTRGPVEVRIGPPLHLAGKSYTALTEQIEAAIRTL